MLMTMMTEILVLRDRPTCNGLTIALATRQGLHQSTAEAISSPGSMSACTWGEELRN